MLVRMFFEDIDLQTHGISINKEVVVMISHLRRGYTMPAGHVRGVLMTRSRLLLFLLHLGGLI